MTEWVLVPREPVDAQLTSMALTYDHGYGLRNAFERENIRLHMAQLHRAMLDAAPAAPQMTDAEMIRTEAWQSITDELAHAAYLRGIEEGKRQAAAPQQAEPVAQIGWADEFGNLFPMGAWKPAQRTHHDSHKTAWRPVFLHPPAAEVQLLRDAVAKLSTIVRVPNAEHIADEHNAAVAFLRRALEGGE